MSEVIIEEKPALTKKEKTRVDKQTEHIARIKRTLIASILGILVGVLSYSPQHILFKRFGTTGLHADACLYCNPETLIRPSWHGFHKTGWKRLALPGVHDICLLVHDMDNPVDLVTAGPELIIPLL